jgi:hypothetical protein
MTFDCSLKCWYFVVFIVNYGNNSSHLILLLSYHLAQSKYLSYCGKSVLFLPFISVRFLCYHDDRFHLANVFKCAAVRILLQRWKQTIMAWDQITVTFVFCGVLRILYVMKLYPRTRKGSRTIYQNIYRVPATHFLIEFLYPCCSLSIIIYIMRMALCVVSLIVKEYEFKSFMCTCLRPPC